MRLIVAFAVALSFFAADQVRQRLATAGSQLLEVSDFSCAGVFLSPPVPAGGGGTTVFPIAYRYEGGARHYFIYSGHRHIYQFPEPTLSSCDTPLNSVTQAKLEGWGGDWGVMDVNNAGDFVPGLNGSHAHRLYWDAGTSQLILSWYPSYAVVTRANSFAGFSLNDGNHTMTRNGCWGIPAYNMLWVGSGVTAIPQSFVAQHLSPGQTWAVGFGGTLGYASGTNYGPMLTAISPPAKNPCAPRTNYDVKTQTLMESHASNGNGPHCYTRRVGCAPRNGPTSPSPGQQAFASYSVDMYATTWDPHGGHGWFTWESMFAMGWYDDGVKHGMVVPISTPSGWINTTVSASPPPTSSTFTVPTVDMHDGYNLKPGDLIWVQTCTPRVDPGCALANNNHLAFLVITAIDATTGSITFRNIGTDGTGSPHPPVVGGAVYGGCIYAHGEPTCTRYTWRMQVYDPAQYGEVIAGKRQPHKVTAADDADFTKIINHFGVPMSNPRHLGGTIPIAAMPDPSAHQFIVAVANARAGGGGNLIYVLNVSQSRPTPDRLPWSLPLSAGLLTLGAGSFLSRRRFA